jgi:hypothetical protein
MPYKTNPTRFSVDDRQRWVDALSQADKQLRQLTRNRPFIAFGGALLFGYLAGRLARG